MALYDVVLEALKLERTIIRYMPKDKVNGMYIWTTIFDVRITHNLHSALVYG